MIHYDKWLLWNPPDSQSSDYIVEKVVKFVNYLLGEIPTEASKFILKKIPTVEVYIKHDELFSRCEANINTKPTMQETFSYWIGVRAPYMSGLISKNTWVELKPSFIIAWVFSAFNWAIYRTKPLSGPRVRFFNKYIADYYDILSLPVYRVTGFKYDIKSINIPSLDNPAITNLPRALNAMLQDIADVYFLWLKGYGEEWKKRIREKIIDQSLPRLRMQLKPMIASIAQNYADLPQEAVPIGELEIASYVLSELEKRIQETTDYVGMIKKNRDWIVKTFGIEEYNRLLKDAEQYQKLLEQKRTEYIKRIEEQKEQIDQAIEQVQKLDTKKLTEEESKALDSVLDSLINTLQNKIKQVEALIAKYERVIKELKEIIG